MLLNLAGSEVQKLVSSLNLLRKLAAMVHTLGPLILFEVPREGTFVVFT